MASWLAPTSFVALCLGIWMFIAYRNTRRQVAATLRRRPNPSHEEFLEAMVTDMSPQVAEFLWKTALPYIEPSLTPHPDDDLIRDLPILDEDWSLDWPRDYAREQGFHESNLPDWPKDWKTTLRNYGRWLSMGPV